MKTLRGAAMSTSSPDGPADAGSETAHQLDAVGLRCPLPVLKARKRLAGLAPGAVLWMRADDPVAPIDVAHFCAEQGHALVSETEEANGVRLFGIRKGGRAPPHGDGTARRRRQSA